jgi:hypothetical protein
MGHSGLARGLNQQRTIEKDSILELFRYNLHSLVTDFVNQFINKSLDIDMFFNRSY